MGILNESLKLAMEDRSIEERDLNVYHPSTQHMIKILAPNSRLTGRQKDIADAVFDLALDMIQTIPDGPDLTAGLRKLFEAKNDFVVASLG